jgi:hypothetical protein
MKTDKYIKAWNAWWSATDNRKIKRLERIMLEQDKKS